MGTSDVDAYTLLRPMPEDQRRAVHEAWRGADVASVDGIVAAVAINRASKQRRRFGSWALGWTVLALLSLADPEAWTLRVVGATVVAGLNGSAWLRCRRGIARLSTVADPAAASERARDLRAARIRAVR